MFMKRIYKILVYVVTLMLTLASLLSCRYDPLDSYSRVPPDRTGDSSEDKGGLEPSLLVSELRNLHILLRQRSIWQICRKGCLRKKWSISDFPQT